MPVILGTTTCSVDLATNNCDISSGDRETFHGVYCVCMFALYQCNVNDVMVALGMAVVLHKQ